MSDWQAWIHFPRRTNRLGWRSRCAHVIINVIKKFSLTLTRGSSDFLPSALISDSAKNLRFLRACHWPERCNRRKCGKIRHHHTLGWVNFYPSAVFGDFSSKLLLDINNVSMEFNLLIYFGKHQWIGFHKQLHCGIRINKTNASL